MKPVITGSPASRLRGDGGGRAGHALGGDLQALISSAPDAILRGVFAVGDVRHRSVKRVASAVGEGSVVIQQVHRYLTEVQRGAVGTGPAC